MYAYVISKRPAFFGKNKASLDRLSTERFPLAVHEGFSTASAINTKSWRIRFLGRLFTYFLKLIYQRNLQSHRILRVFQQIIRKTFFLARSNPVVLGQILGNETSAKVHVQKGQAWMNQRLCGSTVQHSSRIVFPAQKNRRRDLGRYGQLVNVVSFTLDHYSLIVFRGGRDLTVATLYSREPVLYVTPEHGDLP
jgi:hypothetical protein